MNFLKVVQDFFRMLFSAPTPEYKKQKELRRIQQTLRMTTPPLFKNGQIQPAFANSMLSFWRFLSPIRDILLATIGNSDIKTAQKYQDFLFESSLPPDQREMCATFTYEWRRRTVLASDTPEGALTDNENEFTRFLHLFNQPEFLEIDRQIQRLFVVLDVCKYNYADFFLLFDAAFSLEADSADPNFLPVPPKQMLTELSDFYFIAHRFMIDDRLASFIVRLRERIEKTEFTEPQRQKIVKTYANTDSYLKANMPNTQILSILKLAAENPQYEPRKDDSKASRLQAYQLRLSDQYAIDTERIRRAIQENSVLSSIQKLFPNGELLPLNGYTEDLNEIMEQNTPFSLKVIKPLKITRTYFNQFFDEQLATIMNTITLECFFSDKTFEQRLTSAYAYTSTAEQRFLDFEELFTENQTFDQNKIKEWATDTSKESDATGKKLDQLVESLNRYAQDFLQNELTYFERFAVCANELINDTKRTTPDLIANIRTVLMGKKADFINILEKKIETTSLFFSIMKNFAIIHGI